MNKFTYYKVIQEYIDGYGWEDADFFETMSDYTFRSIEERKAFQENRKAYRDNSKYPTRVIKRREIESEPIPN